MCSEPPSQSCYRLALGHQAPFQLSASAAPTAERAEGCLPAAESEMNL